MTLTADQQTELDSLVSQKIKAVESSLGFAWLDIDDQADLVTAANQEAENEFLNMHPEIKI